MRRMAEEVAILCTSLFLMVCLFLVYLYWRIRKW